MDWQQAASLVIVGITAAMFAWNRLRPRKFSFERNTHCGCSAAGNGSLKQSITLRGRKGERPEVIVKM